MHSVNLSAKRVLGEKTQVLKAGSIMKHTDIATSDLDIYLQLPDAKQMTTQDKRLLAEDLRHHVGKRVREVQERSKSIKLIGANGMTVDIVPTTQQSHVSRPDQNAHTRAERSPSQQPKGSGCGAKPEVVLG
jgi:tRNA nucleotidyltransferase (CCA-adding enzyme)